MGQNDLGVRVAVLEEQIRGLRNEIAKQDTEIRRRLDELNHAHANSEARQVHYVTTDKFDGYVSKADEWMSSVTKQLSEGVGRHGGVGLARATTYQNFVLAIMALGVLIALAVAVLK